MRRVFFFPYLGDRLHVGALKDESTGIFTLEKHCVKDSLSSLQLKIDGLRTPLAKVTAVRLLDALWAPVTGVWGAGVGH